MTDPLTIAQLVLCACALLYLWRVEWPRVRRLFGL
jgi:hypothetical protein